MHEALSNKQPYTDYSAQNEVLPVCNFVFLSYRNRAGDGPQDLVQGWLSTHPKLPGSRLPHQLLPHILKSLLVYFVLVQCVGVCAMASPRLQ